MLRPDGARVNTPLPRLQQADGPGRRRRPAGRRHGAGDPGISATAAGVPPPRAGRPARRLLSAARRSMSPATSRSTRWPGRGDELWFVNTRFSCLCTLERHPQLRAALAAAVHHGAGPGGPLPSERPVPGADGPARLRHRPGRDRHAARLAGRQERRRRPARGGDRRSDRCAACRCRTRRAGTTAAVGAGVGQRAASASSIRRPAATTRIAELPGFTRGLDFYGHLAFVGLSQVRESAVFSGIPIAERRWRSAAAASGWWTCAPARRSPSCSSRTRCRRFSPCRCCRDALARGRAGRSEVSRRLLRPAAGGPGRSAPDAPRCSAYPIGSSLKTVRSELA